MLKGIDPVLDGDVLRALDRLGHSDRVVVADANFPAYRLGGLTLTLTVDVPRAVRAVCSVLTLDDVEPVVLMDSTQPLLEVQRQIIDEAGIETDAVILSDRYGFYDLAAQAQVVLRTVEPRTYANVILGKGVINSPM